nr:inactive leucine-rich repeat receptor-like protein kinase CORYNE [Malus domestica]
MVDVDAHVGPEKDEAHTCPRVGLSRVPRHTQSWFYKHNYGQNLLRQQPTAEMRLAFARPRLTQFDVSLSASRDSNTVPTWRGGPHHKKKYLSNEQSNPKASPFGIGFVLPARGCAVPRNRASVASEASPLEERAPKIILSIVLGVLTGVICAILTALLVRCFVRYISRTPILKGPVIFSPKIDPKTLQLALASENQLLGSSPIGKYCRTVLDNGLIIAVKQLGPFSECGSPEAQSKAAKRRIQQELEVLAGLRHRHLMSLRAYVREHDRFSLVYDFVPNGSLEDAMNRVRETELQLSWEVRLRIAVGVIKGLQYLHSYVPQIMHYNLKPTNVMLDSEFEPRLGDYGLAKLAPYLDVATSEYSAPECFQNGRYTYETLILCNGVSLVAVSLVTYWRCCRPIETEIPRRKKTLAIDRYTDKSDIFSFGMILGVLLTGRDPTDPFFGEAASGGSLGRWLRHLQQAGEAREALDKSIIGEEVEEDEMLMAVRIAVVCLSDLPAERPSSDELVHMLTQLHSF